MLVRQDELHTVCQEARCPNIFECWEAGEATFLIGGDQCTRRCDFCQIATGRPTVLDKDEPRRVARAVAAMGLTYATITGVARDDLRDGGAWLYAETVREIHALAEGGADGETADGGNATNGNAKPVGVELLVPDFQGREDLLAEVFSSRPQVFAHNLETVPRVFKQVRPAFRYERSLDVLAKASDAGLVTKSSIMLGLGESGREMSQTLHDLRRAGCQIITITQYLRPSANHRPVQRWVTPQEFDEVGREAESIGFAGVMSGALVRPSCRAGYLYRKAMATR